MVKKLTIDGGSDRLAEMLSISVIFINIDGIDLGIEDRSQLPEVQRLAQRLMLRIQETVKWMPQKLCILNPVSLKSY